MRGSQPFKIIDGADVALLGLRRQLADRHLPLVVGVEAGLIGFGRIDGGETDFGRATAGW
jgi:hypothetical protein